MWMDLRGGRVLLEIRPAGGLSWSSPAPPLGSLAFGACWRCYAGHSPGWVDAGNLTGIGDAPIRLSVGAAALHVHHLVDQ